MFVDIYYIFVQQAIENGILAPKDIAGKRFLIVSSYSLTKSTMVEWDLKSTLHANGAAECKIYGLYKDRYVDASGSFAELADKLADTFDCVFLLDGLEKQKKLMQAVDSIKAVCKKNGTLIVLARTPELQGNTYGINYYEDYWRFDADMLSELFYEFTLQQTINTSNGILVGTKFRLCGDMPERELSQVMVYQNRIKKAVRLGEAKCNYGYFAGFTDLSNIGDKWATDKCSYDHNYLDKYEFFLQNFKARHFNLLELGIFRGDSLRMWQEYFPKADIFGVDIQEGCCQYASDRINIIIADLSDEAELAKLHDVHPSVIIDDASHLWSHQIKALFSLWHCLPHGGVYIIEDMETSVNQKQVTGYDDFPMDAYEVCSRIARITISKEPDDDSPYCDEINVIGMEAELVSVMHGSCVLIKR